LHELNVELVRRARRDGYPAVALLADGAAIHEMVRDRDELLAQERDIDRLTEADDVRALCCYDVLPEDDSLLTELAGLHYRRISDLRWGAGLSESQLAVHGEIDMSNAERFRAVLRPAIAAGVRSVDLGALSFMSAAGIRALAEAADSLRASGDVLHLVNGPVNLTRLLTALGVVEGNGLVLSDRAGAPGGSSGPDGQLDRLARRLADLTRCLLDARTVGEALERIAEAGRHLVPGADVASVTLRDPDGKFHTPAGTDDVSAELDRLQYETGQGPCVAAAQTPGPGVAVSGDLATDPRWPEFGPAAAERGVGAVLSSTLLWDWDARPPHLSGALNLYSRRSHGFTDADCDIALLLVTHASLALASTRAVGTAELTEARLRSTFDSRDVIAHARGVLTERRGIGAEAAFDVLFRRSRELNMKLAGLARALASGRDEPGPPGSR
jgi:anti-anti-sigma factor